MTKKSTEKSLFNKISRRLVKLDLNKILPSIQNMQIYCLSCEKKQGIIGWKEVTMKNKVIREKSRCAICMSYKSRFLKQKYN